MIVIIVKRIVSLYLCYIFKSVRHWICFIIFKYNGYSRFQLTWSRTVFNKQLSYLLYSRTDKYTNWIVFKTTSITCIKALNNKWLRIRNDLKLVLRLKQIINSYEKNISLLRNVLQTNFCIGRQYCFNQKLLSPSTY